MKYYILSFKNRKYVLDIAFFIELLQDSLAYDITSILNELNISIIDIDFEINLDPNKIYILFNDQIVKYSQTSIDLCEKIKCFYINKFYEIYAYKLHNILEIMSSTSNDSVFSYLYHKYPMINNDKESAYLEILNSGDATDISELEKYLEFADSQINTIFVEDNEKNIVTTQYDNLNELMITLILHFNNMRYDFNSLSTSKQLKNV